MNVKIGGYLCCFCYQPIESTNVDPAMIHFWINIDKSDQQDQFFWCHVECFRAKLHENMKEDFRF